MDGTDAVTTGLISRNMLSNAAYLALRERIIALDLQPGHRLNIDRLATELGISPTPLREALSRLTAEGLVRVEPYKGFFVAEMLDFEELRDLADLRALLESYAVERARERIGSVLEDMRSEVEVMDRLADARGTGLRPFNGADARFHAALISASGSPTLERTYDKINAHAQMARLFGGHGQLGARQANEEHKRIVAALSEGDFDKARQEVVDHISNVVERLTGGTEEGSSDE